MIKKEDFPEVVANNLGNGSLRWFQHGVGFTSSGAALLGRSIALYDYVMDFDTDLSTLTSDVSRAKRFTAICIWIDSASKRVRNAFKSICYDYPGKGKEAVISPDVTVDEIAKWYDWEVSALYYSDMLRDSINELWDSLSVDFCQDLCIPYQKLELVKRWSEPMGRDMQMCVSKAIDETSKEGFIRAWKEMENTLLALSINDRDKLVFEEE